MVCFKLDCAGLGVSFIYVIVENLPEKINTKFSLVFPFFGKAFALNKNSLFFLYLFLLNIALEVLTLHQVGDIILIVILLALSTALGLLHVLVALGELTEGGEAVGAQLVQDTGDELGEFLLLAVTVEGEGVGGDGGVDFFGANMLV